MIETQDITFEALRDAAVPLVGETTALSDIIADMGVARLSVPERWERVEASFDLPAEFKSVTDLIGKYNGQHLVIHGSGPSIEDTFPQLLELAAKGAKIMAVNAAHDWMIERGLTPHFGIMADPKPWVAGYQTPTAGVKYLIASQCDPSVFERFRGHGGVHVWHIPPCADTTGDEAKDAIIEQELMAACDRIRDLSQKKRRAAFAVVQGGSTSGMRASDISTRMGFIGDHLFGMDSSGVRNSDSTKMHGHDKPHVAKEFGMPVFLTDPQKGLDLNKEYWTNNPMAQQAIQWELILRHRINAMREGTYPVKVYTVYGHGLFPDWAALRGLHADHGRADELRKLFGHRRPVVGFTDRDVAMFGIVDGVLPQIIKPEGI